jgi:hypothetical protein
LKPFEAFHGRYFHPDAAILCEDNILEGLCNVLLASEEVRTMFQPEDYLPPPSNLQVTSGKHPQQMPMPIQLSTTTGNSTTTNQLGLSPKSDSAPLISASSADIIDLTMLLDDEIVTQADFDRALTILHNPTA